MGSASKQKSDRRRRDLAMIHIGKKQVGLSDPDYRQMISSIGGADSESAGDLDAKGRRAVIDHLKSLGFNPVHKSAKASGMHIQPSAERKHQLSKIGALLADMDLPWKYADGIARQMFAVERVRWLKPRQLQKVIVALVYKQKGSDD